MICKFVSKVYNTIKNCINSLVNSEDKNLTDMKEILEQLDLLIYENDIRISNLERLTTCKQMVDVSTQTDIETDLTVRALDNLEEESYIQSQNESTIRKRKQSSKKVKTRFSPYRSAKNKALVAFKVQCASI